MSWWEAFVWGTLIVAVLLGLLIAGYYYLIPYSLLHDGHLVELRRRVRACALVVRKSEKRRAQTIRTPDSGIVSSKLGASSPFGAIRQTSRRPRRRTSHRSRTYVARASLTR